VLADHVLLLRRLAASWLSRMVFSWWRRRIRGAPVVGTDRSTGASAGAPPGPHPHRRTHHRSGPPDRGRAEDRTEPSHGDTSVVRRLRASGAPAALPARAQWTHLHGAEGWGDPAPAVLPPRLGAGGSCCGAGWLPGLMAAAHGNELGHRGGRQPGRARNATRPHKLKHDRCHYAGRLDRADKEIAEALDARHGAARLRHADDSDASPGGLQLS